MTYFDGITLDALTVTPDEDDWSDWERSPYYYPQRYGLSVVGTIHEDGLSYEFNMLAVWQRDDGALLYGRDSGCSCPQPFESQTAADLTPVTRETFDRFYRDVSNFPAKGSAKHDLFAKVNALLP